MDECSTIKHRMGHWRNKGVKLDVSVGHLNRATGEEDVTSLTVKADDLRLPVGHTHALIRTSLYRRRLSRYLIFAIPCWVVGCSFFEIATANHAFQVLLSLSLFPLLLSTYAATSCLSMFALN